MSLARVKIWVSEVLSASDLNAEFNNILNYLNGPGVVTLSSPTITIPTITGGTVTALTTLGIRSTGAAFDLTLVSSEVLLAGRTLDIRVNDAASLLDIGATNDQIYGLTLSTAGSSATFSVASGGAQGMRLGASISKTTSAWAVGTGNGSLDTGAIANTTWYHVHLIRRADTGVVDILTSLSASAPTMPASYGLSRRIGAMKTDGSAKWILFVQNGDEFLWAAPVTDVTDAGTLGAAEELNVLSVPTNVKVNALIRGEANHAVINTKILLNSPDETNVAPATGNYTAVAQVANQACSFTTNVRTNTSGQIRARSSAATTSLEIVTYGWIDRRGRT